jgi:hypothetical protein
MRFFTSFFFSLSFALPVFGQANQGELQLNVVDPSGATTKASVRIVSEANQYAATLTTDADGRLVAQHLPFGLYGVEIHQPGFDDVSESVDISSAIPARQTIQLKLSSVEQSVVVSTEDTLLNTAQPGSVNQVGSALIQNRVGSIPGRSIQDLVNSQPGWLYEGNAVLHPRGSEYQTQFVLDGIPLTDNRSPSFGAEIEADDVETMSIYTAGIPAEYGRKLGGVVEINTQQDSEPGFHGQLSLDGGSFNSAGAFAKGQYSWDKNVLGASADGSRTDHYLNPVVPQNYSNTGTLGDFSVDYRRELTSNDKLAMSVRHEIARYDIPNELIQQAAGQRQNAGNIETMGIVSYQHLFSANSVGDLHGMVRDSSNNFYSNPESTPVEVFQNNSFRDGYFKAGVTFNRGPQEWKVGVESDNSFLHENTNYNITDPSQYDDGTLLTFAFQGNRPDLEQAVFVQDLIHLSHWSISAGVRWDHYQLLLNKQAVQPRFSIARYFESLNTVVHFSYDRIFQTPSFENLLLSGSDAVKAISSNFLRLPVEPSQGNYYELGLSSGFAKHLKFNANYFRRSVNDYADDDQIDNTSISFPISFRKAIIYGAEGKIEVPEWHHFSGIASYSYEVANVWNPVTGGLFLGQNASDAASNLSGHFPASQDQRNTVRGRVRYQATSRIWLAGGVQYDTGLPFQFGGSADDALAQYGQQVIDRINFDRGRILPSFQVNASAGIDLYHGERMKMRLQADGQNLTDVLNVIDFGGLFSGNAIGPSRSFWLRLTGSF